VFPEARLSISNRAAAFLCLFLLIPDANFLRARPQATLPTPVARSYAPFLGKWTGELEYWDSSSDQRVKLPSWLQVRVSTDGKSLDFHFTFDDGPKKIVEDNNRSSIDPSKDSFKKFSVEHKSEESYQLSGIEAFAENQGGTLVFSGMEIENDKKVDIRIIINTGRNHYRDLKQTRASGAEFLFRDALNFVRREPPTPEKLISLFVETQLSKVNLKIKLRVPITN
jgi:hypothetical protein